MIRNIKVLGTALVAALAISAVAASLASADSFTAESAPAIYTGSQQTANVLTTTVGTQKCTTTTFKGTVNATSTTTVSVSPSYSGCTAFGFPSDYDVNGCEYLFHISPTAGVTTGTVALVCPAGKEITITAKSSVTNPTLKCTIHTPAQSGLGTVTYKNVGAGATREILFELNLTGIKYTHTAGTGLGACTSGSATSGTYTGSVLFTGENAGGAHVGIFLS